MAGPPLRTLPPPPGPSRGPAPGTPASSWSTARVASGAAPTPAWRRPLTVIGSLAAAAVALAMFDPRHTHLVPPCPFRTITGLDCPLCGGMRAVHDLTHLDLVGAAGQNLLVTLLAPLAGVALLVWLALSLDPARTAAVGRRLPRAAAVVALLAVAFVVFGVVRDLPIASVHWLRSG